MIKTEDLGDAVRQTNPTGGTSGYRAWDAFGNRTIAQYSPVGPFGYAGGHGYQEDGDSGLKLLGHRYYDPTTGRFLTRDPIKDGRNWYAYVDNNPLKNVDPEGLEDHKNDRPGKFYNYTDHYHRLVFDYNSGDGTGSHQYYTDVPPMSETVGIDADWVEDKPGHWEHILGGTEGWFMHNEGAWGIPEEEVFDQEYPMSLVPNWLRGPWHGAGQWPPGYQPPRHWTGKPVTRPVPADNPVRRRRGDRRS